MRRSSSSSKTTQRQPTRSKSCIDYSKAWAALAKINYSFYVEYTNPGYKHGKHTELICKALEDVESGKTKRLMIFMPPRHSKSFTVSETFPSWFLGRDPERKVMMISYGEDLAVQFGRANLQKIEQYGPSVFNLTPAADHARATDWGVSTGRGYMKSAGLGGTITGKGADLMIIDDPIKNAKEAGSKTYRDTLWNEYSKTLYTRLQPGGAIIMIFTRWNEDDLAGRILKDPRMAKGWKILSIPAEAKENDILGRAEGEPLWPEMGFDKDWIEETKIAVGSKTWSSLYQQDPKPDSGQVFKREWLQYYNKAPDKFDIILQSWDFTFKELSDNDYVVGQVWGKIGSSYYLLDQVRARMDFTASLQAMRALTAKWPQARAKLVEDKANGSAIISMLRKEIHGLIPIQPDGGKEARAQAVSPLWEAKNVYIPDPSICSWIGDYVEELIAFPSAAHDDQVDGTSQALNYLSTKFITFGAVSKPKGF